MKKAMGKRMRFKTIRLLNRLGSLRAASRIGLLALLPMASLGQTVDLDNYQGLTSDFKSFRVGEPISVIVIESTHAESSAATGVEKDSSLFAEASDSVNAISAGFALGADSTGSGKTTRNGNVRTQISARITEVLAGDIYRISGHHNLKINDETQIVAVTGLIRRRDISEGNSVLSSRIAEANIQISGKGNVSEANKQNLFYKVMQWLRLL